MSDRPQIQRCSNHDYKSPCIYMLTVTVEGRRPLLGKVAGDAHTAHIELSPLGVAVRYELYSLCQRYPQLRLLQHQVMPDHVHIIIQVTERLEKPLGSLFSSWKIACGHAYGRLVPTKSPAGTSALAQDKGAGTVKDEKAGTGGDKGAGTKTATREDRGTGTKAGTGEDKGAGTKAGTGGDKGTGTTNDTGTEVTFSAPLSGATTLAPQGKFFRRLFAEGYNDRILQGKGQLQRMIDYIRDNPRRLLLKRDNIPYFTLHRNITVAGHTFDAIGNLAHLQAPLMAVHCRRHWSPAELNAYITRCAEASKKGTVLIGAFISEAEKAIALKASENHLALIHLMGHGFPDLYKPVGQSFYACAEGRLLQLAPWKHHATHTVVSREQCNALNTMAETIASTL